jgi:hypothetical protein
VLYAKDVRSYYRGEGMEIFGGFMVMMSILGLFLVVVWLIMPFVVLTIKGKQDRSLELLEAMEKQLATIDERITRLQPVQSSQVTTEVPPVDNDLATPDHENHSPVLPLA